MKILNTMATNDFIFEPERNYWWYACCQETIATELILLVKHTDTQTCNVNNRDSSNNTFFLSEND